LVLRSAWRQVTNALVRNRQRRGVVTLAIVAVAAFALDFAVRGFHEPAPGENERVHVFAWPVSATYARQLRLVAAAIGRTRTLPASPEMRSDFSRIAGADVLVIFVESYGAVTFERTEMVAGLAARPRAFDPGTTNPAP